MFKEIFLVLFLFLISSVSAWAVATSDAYYQAGNKLYGQGNYDLCLRYYKAAIQVDPQNWKAYQAMGSCEYHMGLKDAAIRDFNQSLTINPNNPPLQAFVNKISGNSFVPQPTSSAAPPSRHGKLFRFDALPEKGSITWNITMAADIDSYDDFTDYYGPTLNANGKLPIGVELGIGGDYTFSPEFQVGLNLEGIYKNTLPVSAYDYNTGATEQDTWTDICWGPAIDAKYLISINRSYNFIIRGEIGYYNLMSTLDFSASSGNVIETGTLNMTSSSIGALLGIEVEWMRGPGWALDLGLSYRALSFSNINYIAKAVATNGYSSASGTSNGILKDASGSNAFIDFSGINITTSIRFF